jgi:hypothetical protein
MRAAIIALCAAGLVCIVALSLAEGWDEPRPTCHDSFGVLICHVPGRQYPVWFPACEYEPGNAISCLPTLREASLR